MFFAPWPFLVSNSLSLPMLPLIFLLFRHLAFLFPYPELYPLLPSLSLLPFLPLPLLCG